MGRWEVDARATAEVFLNEYGGEDGYINFSDDGIMDVTIVAANSIATTIYCTADPHSLDCFGGFGGPNDSKVQLPKGKHVAL